MPASPPDDPEEGPNTPSRPLQRPTRRIPVVRSASTRETEAAAEATSETAQPAPVELEVPLMAEADPDAPPTIRREGKLIARTEDLADRALDRLKSGVGLPNVAAEARGIAATLGAIRSRALTATVALYIVTASVGVAVTAVEDLHDWYMHVAMYVVILSFLFIYVKSHLLGKTVARAFYAVTTSALMGFFAWVLYDLVPPRLIVVDGQAVERPLAELLGLPAALLLVAACGLLLHWLLLARHARGG